MTARLLPEAVSAALPPLVTKQSDGFTMANIALNGTADELGITLIGLAAGGGAQRLRRAQGHRRLRADPYGTADKMVPMGSRSPR